MLEIPKTINLHFQRFEFKYLLPVELADILIPKLLKYMEWDPYVAEIPTKQYQVASLYYDSAGLACYYEKLAGVEKRKKLRLRVYDQKLQPDSKIYMEIKRRDDAIILKDRVVASHHDCLGALVKGDYVKFKNSRPEDEQKFLDEFFWTKEHNCLMPKIMVVYQRAPLVGKIDKRFRVTFDSDLKTYPADWIELKEDGRPVNPDSVILEVKFNNILPAWFHHIIKDYQLERISYSKYAMSIEACQKNYLL